MSLTLDEVKRIAWLARIEVSEAEAAATRDQLNGIFGLIGEMQAVDTTGIEPMPHGQDVVLRLREDRAHDQPEPRAAFQAVAPQVEGGLYLVPKVIE